MANQARAGRECRAVLHLEEDGRVAGYSPSLVQICGLAAQDRLPVRLADFRDSANPVLPALASLLSTAKSDGERHLQLPDGRSLFVSWSFASLPDRTLCTVGIRDSTFDGRRSLEQQLAEAQRIAQLGSWEWDIVSNSLVWSDELYRVYGLEPHELTPTYEGFLERVHPEDRDLVKSHVQTAYQGRQEFDFEHRIVRPDGEIRILHGRGQVITDEADRPVRMVGTGQDITDRKIAERNAIRLAVAEANQAEAETQARRWEFLAKASETLASSLHYEQTLRSVAQLMVPILGDCCVVDLLEEDGRLVRVAVAHGDPDRAELVERLRRLEPSLEVDTSLARVINSGKPEIVHDFRLETLGGEDALDQERLDLIRDLNPQSFMILPLDARGRVLGTIAFVSSDPGRSYSKFDLRFGEETARHVALAIDNARLYHEARHATQSRDELLAILSHDLKNLLHVVLGHARLLSRDTQPAKFPSLEAIEKSGRLMERLIRDLLDISRIEGGALALSTAPVDFSEVLAEVGKQWAPLAEEAGVQLRLDVASGLPQVRADRDRLIQVLNNLLDNALRHTQPEGVVSVSGEPAPAGELTVAVADTGCGIPEEHQRHLFDRFWQASRAGRAGSGLGLAIAKGIVESHGGRIWVESRLGAGTAFRFSLPLAAPPESS